MNKCVCPALSRRSSLIGRSCHKPASPRPPFRGENGVVAGVWTSRWSEIKRQVSVSAVRGPAGGKVGLGNRGCALLSARHHGTPVVGCAKGRIWATWVNRTRTAGKPRRPRPGRGGAGGGQDITAVLSQVSALQSEIDRLIALVNTAAKKLEGLTGRAAARHASHPTSSAIVRPSAKSGRRCRRGFRSWPRCPGTPACRSSRRCGTRRSCRSLRWRRKGTCLKDRA